MFLFGDSVWNVDCMGKSIVCGMGVIGLAIFMCMCGLVLMVWVLLGRLVI